MVMLVGIGKMVVFVFLSWDTCQHNWATTCIIPFRIAMGPLKNELGPIQLTLCG